MDFLSFALAVYLGLEEGEDGRIWPTLGDAARQCQVPRATVSAALLRARERWLKSPPNTGARNDIDAFLATHGEVMTAEELALALLAARGSAERDDALRLRLAAGVVRACVEAEAELAGQRFQCFDGEGAPLVGIGPDHAAYARRLGQAADEVARAEPLLAPQRAAESLEAVARPESLAPLSTQRLLKLATAASATAALSSRSEIYPRGMDAAVAIRQSLGALVGPKFFTAEQIGDRVRGRYPESGPLPARPALDALLAAAGLNLVWSDAGANGAGFYAPAGAVGPSAGTTTFTEAAAFSAEIAEARALEERLDYAARTGGFLALTVAPRLARHAEAELLERFGPERLSFDDLLLTAMKEQARALKVEWPTVLAADAAPPGSRDWTNLMRLVQKALPQVRNAIAGRGRNVLLAHPGLLARYQLMPLIDELRDRAGRPGSLPGLWLLVPMNIHGLPAVDDVPVPVISSAQWARIPQAWVENAHRAGAGLGAQSQR